MSEYNLIPGVNAQYEFPPEVRQALLESLNIRNVGAPMTTNERNALNTAALDPGYYVFNTDTMSFQVWRPEFADIPGASVWHDGLESPGSQKWWPGATIPAGWFKHTGAALKRLDYAALFKAIGTTYGGSGTPAYFNLPLTAGRVMIDTDGDVRKLAQIGGVDKYVLSPAQMPQHRHAGTTDNTYMEHRHLATTDNPGDHHHSYDWITTGEFNATGSGANPVYRASRSSTSTGGAGGHTHHFWTDYTGQNHTHPFTTDYQGGNAEVDNMQKFMVGHFIIKY